MSDYIDYDTDHPDPEARLAFDVNAVVMLDIKSGMRAVVEREPIKNDGSFAIKLLWQIFEAAEDRFENFQEIMILSNNEVEMVFKKLFPVFIAEYPKVMTLDT